MTTPLRFDVADRPLRYAGGADLHCYEPERIASFNQRHQEVLGAYRLELTGLDVHVLDATLNGRSALGAFTNKQLREAVILAAALPAAAVVLHGFGALARLPPAEQTPQRTDEAKRANDRTAAQVMAEVLQTTTMNLAVGEEVIIESTVTEGVRLKPGKEVGGNPTIAVGALFGKPEHRETYGRHTPKHVELLSMGNDVIDGTTKSAKGLHSSITALYVTQSGTKRHLPDIYVQRWMAGVPFPEFDPRHVSTTEAAAIVAGAYGVPVESLSSFFIDRARHRPPMDELNALGVSTPFDRDGDLFPALVLGLDGVVFDDGRPLHSMLGEIGGSAEWALGVLPLVWRGGQALGMLTSQSSLTRRDRSPEELWRERFHYTEEEHMAIQDARFEHKPFFTIDDIMERPFAGGVSAFGAISDNLYYPPMRGVGIDDAAGMIRVHVLAIDSLGVTKHWDLTFRCLDGIAATRERMRSPKEALVGLTDRALATELGRWLADDAASERMRIFVNNEFYPGLIRQGARRVILRRSIDGLVERGALSAHDRDILELVRRAAPEWFVS